jgi:uncharacterized protein with ParB-like and HNH nuclease domain
MPDNMNVCTLRELFEKYQSIRIPPYQRAYSWGTKQWKQFIGDLNDQKPGKSYHLGQFIFETPHDSHLFVVDGQQRLMTTVLFFAAFAKTEKAKNGEYVALKLYLSDTMHAIDDDDEVFSDIKKGDSVEKINKTLTHSQKQMVNAFIFFDMALSKCNKTKLETIRDSLENAVVGVFLIGNRLEATQVFEYQNSRGIKATEFELVKAFLMHQVYLQSSNENSANENIKGIQKTVTDIYRSIEAVDGYFSEDHLMDRYCWLKYDCDGTLVAIKKITTGIDESDDDDESEEKRDISIKTIKNINGFFDGFLEICQTAQDIKQSRFNPLVANLFLLPTTLYWDYLIFAVLIKDKPSNIDSLLKLVELVCIQIMLVKLNGKKSKKNFLYDWAYKIYHEKLGIDTLFGELRKFVKKGECPDGKEWSNLVDLIGAYKDNGYHYNYPETTKYILWQYENDLREKGSLPRLLDKKYDKLTIEHILARNSEEKENTETFQERWMNNIGNLSLLSTQDNSSLSNHSFDEKKLAKYKELADKKELVLYSEIIDKAEWRQTEVKNRRDKIYSFIDKYFSPNGK